MPNNFSLSWIVKTGEGTGTLNAQGQVDGKMFQQKPVSLGIPLSWHSMHSRYIIANGEMDVSLNDGLATGINSAVIPNKTATILKFTNPNKESKSNNIMIWSPSSTNKINYTNDNIDWMFSGDRVKEITMYESSYVNINKLLTEEGSKFNDLSNSVTTVKRNISDLSNKIASNKAAFEKSISDLSNNIASNEAAVEKSISDLSNNIASNKTAIEKSISDI